MSIPSKSKIVRHWMPWLEENVIDINEPVCWACKNFWWGKYDVEVEMKSTNEMLENWNNIKRLERCHIIPRQFGGSDTVDNLFLMCKSCHDKAPNTKSREAFLQWANAQSYVTNLFETIHKELEIFELIDKVDEIPEIFKNGIPEEIKDNLGAHFNRRHGKELTISTLVAAIAQYLENET